MLNIQNVTDEDVFVWYDQAKELRACRIAPNKLMLRKCKKPSGIFLIGEGGEDSRIADAILQDITGRPDMRYADGWCEVLAVGRKRAYTAYEKDHYEIPKGFRSPVKKGDFVCIPEHSKHGRHWRCGVTGYDYDIVVAEWEPFLWVPKG